MRKAFKYRLFTNANQERELSIALETHRRLYNECLAQRIEAYKLTGKTVKYTEQSAWFKLARKTNEYYGRINFSSAQATMRRLEKSYANFFRRVKAKTAKAGFPRFKGRDHFDSFEFPSHGDGCRISGDRLRIQHVGLVRVRLHRPWQGDIKTVAVKREGGKWFVILSCDLGELNIVQKSHPQVGIDVGLSHFLTTSEGETIANPKYLKAELPELRRLSRSLSRKKRGGSNRRKARKKVAKLHVRVANLRKEHHHQVAVGLVRRFGLIATESLNIQGMLRNRRLARSIADAGWYGFQQILRTKAESAGCQVLMVDPRGTSQSCVCGAEVRKTLRDRWHDCPKCGLSQQRDHVSARIILARGLQARTEPAGVKPDASRVSRRSRRLQSAE